MPDREKVINGLREVKEWVAEPNGAGSIETDIVLNAVNGALALLKAQEPVIAVKLQSKKYIGRTGIAYDGSCGNCNAYLMRAWRACPLCGRAVKWDG